MKDKKKDKKEKKKIKELEKSGGDFRTSNIFRSNDKNYTVNQYNNNNNIEEESAGLLFIPNEQTQSSPANFESLIHLSEIPTNILENFRIATLSNSQPNVSSRAVDFEYSYPKQADIFSPTPMVPQISLSTSMGNVPTSMKSTQYSLQFPLSPISPLSPPPHSPVTSPLPFSLPSPNLFAPPLPLSPQPSPQFSPQFQESNCKWNDLFQYSMKEFFQSDSMFLLSIFILFILLLLLLLLLLFIIIIIIIIIVILFIKLLLLFLSLLLLSSFLLLFSC